MSQKTEIDELRDAIVAAAEWLTIPFGTDQEKKLGADLLLAWHSCQSTLRTNSVTVHPDGPPGVDMEIQREAAMWRWIKPALADTADLDVMRKAWVIRSAIAYRVDVAVAIAFCMDNETATQHEILDYLESVRGA